MMAERMASPMPPERNGVARAYSLWGLGIGMAGAAALVAAWQWTGSQLALVQAADSVVDSLTAAGLWWAARISREPPDENHPAGHQPAEPIGALLVAVLTGALCFEVASQAIDALNSDRSPALPPSLVGVFAAKGLAKSWLARAALRRNRRSPSPVLQAIGVDSRNDALVGAVAIVGYFGARFGSPRVDAWLALPLAAWIGASAVWLGLENLRLLMGEAAPPERRRDLLALASSVPGVRRAHSLKAYHWGSGLMVWVQVVVDPELSVREGHDIGHAVENRICAEGDVVQVHAHVDVDEDED